MSDAYHEYGYFPAGQDTRIVPKEKEPSELAALNGSETGAVAAKWECTPEEAELKIKLTMKIMELDRPNAIAFLLAVHMSAVRRSPNCDSTTKTQP